ncbi:dTDP-glucose 4,6-dehydratase [Cohnella xylanilytica]|uniref:dTDP-glucose 4,6-dehydratase n=1 Tax=Cohnella xylanilytica TaxID=557555 RepID=A0A841TZ11_9BACL|nr:dTDP-glucose 4,6-dehydratase [Cohnella xylanilytica]MBB6692208.1 dTDP-glucose 4,6-dehydratase [Cohnella xylanilytica]
MTKKIEEQIYLVTGGAGFIGSNFIRYMINNYSHIHIINLDKMTYAADQENLCDVKKNGRYQFIQGDICNRALIDTVFNEYDIAGVFHFAAESHVDNSIEDPGEFFQTNVIGTYQVIDAARKKWMSSPFVIKPKYSNCRFLHVSTDEVFGTLGDEGLFKENSPYSPNSPYSASKAGADFVVRSYHSTFGLNVVTTNCSNNYGPYQHDEKLIPTIIRKAINGEKIPIYGDGKNIRDWLFVEDHCKAIDLVFNKSVAGETYNIGGFCELTNIEIAYKICDIMDKLMPRGTLLGSHRDLITYVTDRPGHDKRYAIDSSKIMRELGWKPQENIEDGLMRTIRWYLSKYKAKNEVGVI